MSSYIVPPNIDLKNLSSEVKGVNQIGEEVTANVTLEKPLTVFLNSAEIVTSMTIGDYPELLALGFLFNQRIIKEKREVKSVDFDEELKFKEMAETTDLAENRIGVQMKRIKKTYMSYSWL